MVLWLSVAACASACGSGGDQPARGDGIAAPSDDPPSNASAPTPNPQQPAFNPQSPPVNGAAPTPNPQQPTPGSPSQSTGPASGACSDLCAPLEDRCQGACSNICSQLVQISQTCAIEVAALLGCIGDNGGLDCRGSGSIGIPLGDCREAVQNASTSPSCLQNLLGD
jgi:hypothetical protein